MAASCSSCVHGKLNTVTVLLLRLQKRSAQLSVHRNENSRSSDGQLRFLVYTLELASRLADEHGMHNLCKLCPT